jgi:hypothetical protein
LCRDTSSGRAVATAGDIDVRACRRPPGRLTGLDLPAHMLFEKPTAGELADHLHEELFGRDG